MSKAEYTAVAIWLAVMTCGAVSILYRYAVKYGWL